MSFYRTLLAAVAAVAIATPVFADDAAPAQSTDSNAPAATQPAATDNSAAQPSAAMDQSTAATDSKVNINKASAKELMKVKGMTASQARAIVAYRKKHAKEGGFKATSDLANVKAFKKMKADKLQAIEDQLSVD